MTDQTVGAFAPGDTKDFANWLTEARDGEGSLEQAFTENASTLVGWFCLLLDEVERLEGSYDALQTENDDLCDSLADAESIMEGPEEECDDLRCSFCHPSFHCSSTCSHQWMQWDDEDPDSWTFCVLCGNQSAATPPEVNEYEDYCPVSSWSHDDVELGEFRTERGELISRNADKRRICKDCFRVTPPKAKKAEPVQEFLDTGGATAVPLDNGPTLLDPLTCEHKEWTTFSTGWNRCRGCASWVEPEENCPFGAHDPVAIGVKGTKGAIFVCTKCHKEFDGKPDPKSSAPRIVERPSATTAPKVMVEEPAPVLPDPVAHPSRDATVSEVTGAVKIAPSEDQLPFGEGEAVKCECGWSDPHTHNVDPNVTGSVPTAQQAAEANRAKNIKAWDPTLYNHSLGCKNRNVRYKASGGCQCPAYNRQQDDWDEDTPLTDETLVGKSANERALIAAAMVWQGIAHGG